MKRFLLIVCSYFFCLNLMAQDIEKSKAMEIVLKNKTAIGLSDDDVINSNVSSAYQSSSSGLSMVYLQQTYKGLPVFNQLQSLAFKNDILFSNFGERISDIKSKVNTLSIFPSVTPDVAVTTALRSKKIFNVSSLHSTTLIPGRKFDFGKCGIANENITAELLWVPVLDGKQVILCWQVYLVPNSSSDYWMIRVDANSNKIISENNLTVFCGWDKNEKNNIVHRSNFVMASKANKKKSISPNAIFENIQSQNKVSNSPTLVNSASYRVVPFPYESPSHCPTLTALVTNPWSAASGNATSLNWHSTGTVDYNTTRGNNVLAQEDVNGNNGTGVLATSTTPSDPLSFDFAPNFTVAPTNSTAATPNQQFNLTNLFYWNNIMHDITYLYGFDEAAGNFQSNNQGRGGSGNDYVLADAQDGTGTNNANFSTPGDGGSGRMQMYLWNAVPGFNVNSPSSIAGPYQAVESGFSTENKLINVGPVTGQVIYYNDNAAGTLHEACTGAPVNSITGKIALIDRANCNFTVKVLNAQNAGAIAVIMVNNVAGSPIIMGGTDNTITIPAVMISIDDGLILKNQLANNLNVTLSSGAAIDGDVDNGVICHEYGHGISNRLTGGPANTSCLGNAEQMGEGWSDYLSLMVTQDWANSNLTTGFTNPRGIGTYVFGQTPSQSGIRTKKYCTDFAVNNLVYATTIPTEIHDLGEIWCAALWDMTWNIIEQTGTINPSIYNTSTTAGNSIAMKLVMEGLKLQPCSPGFIDGRNAILKADSILYGGAYNCSIREAFRRRGMGINASQGSSGSVTDQVADFTPYVTMRKSQNIDSVAEGQTVTYTSVVNSCSPVTNYILRDTLPANVTYVSGGTYDAATRVVSFPVNFTTGQSQAFSFVVSANAGSYFAPQNLLNESVTSTTLPSTLTASSTTANTWSVSTTQSQSAPNSLFTADAAATSDQKLETAALSLGTGTSAFKFSHWYNSQVGFDGGVVEISTDNGTTWTDLSNKITAGYYNATIATGSGPLATRKAWSGNSNGFKKASINLSSYAGQNVKLRFRFGSNATISGTGWYVDDILVERSPVVNIRASLFNSTGTRISYSDTVTRIIQTVVCNSVAVNAQPTNVITCVGSDAVFSVTADGTTPSYQWQVSTDGGATYTNIAGATTATLTLPAVTASMNNNKYRVLISNACPSSVTSTGVTLTTNLPASINAQPTEQTACVGANASFSVSASGTNISYQWQVSTDGGITFSNIAGATSSTYSITGVTASQNGNKYRVVVTGCNPAPVNSDAVLLTVSNQASIAVQPTNTPACTGGVATFSVTASGSSLLYQWQVSTDGGVTYNNIGIATTASTLVLNGISSSMNNNKYRVLITNNCSSSVLSDAGTLIVSDPASLTSQPNSNAACEGADVSFNVTATGTNISYQWQVSTDGGITYTNISGATAATLVLNNVTASMNNNRYRAVLFSCSDVGLNSDEATLTVNNLASVSSQPADVDACVGSSISFSTVAIGNNISYQWQISTDGGISYTDINGAITATLSLSNVTLSMDNNRYRVIVSNNCPSSATSTSAILTVSSNAIVSAQPVSTSVCEGLNASFNAVATGSGFQWQMSSDGGLTYSNIAGATNSTLSVNNVTLSMNGNRYRLVVAGCASTSLQSDAAILNVNAQASIATQPNNITSCVGNNVTFNSTVSGSNLTYQWQISTDGGVSFTDIPGQLNTSLSLNNIALDMNNNLYRVVIIGDCTPSLISTAASLSVNNQASIVSQPVNASACPGNSVDYTIAASGPGLTYQWQVSTDGGVTFTNINGATNSTVSITGITTSMNNNVYSVIVGSSCSATGTTSSIATLTVLPEAVVNAAPQNYSGCAGDNASFTADISGTGVSYQWQVSTDGGNTYTNISGATSSTLSLNNIATSMNNNRYRIIASANPCGVVTTAAILSVLPSPVVTVTASPYHNLLPGLQTTLTATSVPASNNYNWYKDGIIISGANGRTINVNYDNRGVYTAKDLNGCDNISNSITVSDSLTNNLFVYPNPNNGTFIVQQFNNNASQKRIITLFDAKGARVYYKEFTLTSGSEAMEVVIKKLASGTYMLILSDSNGNTIATKKIVKG